MTTEREVTTEELRAAGKEGLALLDFSLKAHVSIMTFARPAKAWPSGNPLTHTIVIFGGPNEIHLIHADGSKDINRAIFGLSKDGLTRALEKLFNSLARPGNILMSIPAQNGTKASYLHYEGQKFQETRNPYEKRLYIDCTNYEQERFGQSITVPDMVKTLSGESEVRGFLKHGQVSIHFPNINTVSRMSSLLDKFSAAVAGTTGGTYGGELVLNMSKGRFEQKFGPL